jgi:type I restriction enzyme S subunit
MHLQGKSTGPIPFYKVGDISEAWQQGRRFLSSAHHYVTTAVAESLGAEPLPSCTTVLAKIGAAIALNRRAMLSQPALVDNNVFGIVPDVQVLDPSYLFYIACTWRLSELSRATTVPSLRKGDVESITIPLPPLSEQRRIGLEIDRQLTRLDDALATLRRVQRNLKRYRTSVLKAAVEGRLVPTEAELARAEGRTYEPAWVLLERIFAERRRLWEADERTGIAVQRRIPENDRRRARYAEHPTVDASELSPLPEGWTWTRIDVAGRVQLGRQRSPAHHTGSDMRPYLRVANVFEDRIDITDVMSMNFSARDFETYRLKFGDILLNEGQSPHLVGRPAMYRNELQGACFTNSLVRFQASDGVVPRFALVVFLAQLHTRRYMRIAQITTNIAHLGAGRFAEIEFPLPPRAEQVRIADEVERLLTIADATTAAVLTDLDRISRLRQSILKWAFEGRLVDQDPTEEPGSVLLERIKAERQEQASNPSRAKKGRTGRTAAANAP